jgi:hypothetical protein
MSALLFLFFFIFAILSVSLFHDIKYEINNEDNILTNQQNLGVLFGIGFKNFLEAFITLFRIATGENCKNIMYDTTRDKNYGCI